MIDFSKPVQTLSGCKVEILTTERPSTTGHTIAAMTMTNVDGSPRPNAQIEMYLSDGRVQDWCTDTYPLNLINVPPPVVKTTTYQNIYSGMIPFNPRMHGSREAAARCCHNSKTSKRIAVLRRDYENDVLVSFELEKIDDSRP